MNRPSHEDYFLTIARAVARRSSCLSRKVGCVLVNKRNNILATGYNGYASGTPNCIDTGICARKGSPSGQNLDLCAALHAEMNALLQALDVFEIETAYVTTSPCITCTKLLMNTSCKRIVFIDLYPVYEQSKELWESVGRDWIWFNPASIFFPNISYIGDIS